MSNYRLKDMKLSEDEVRDGELHEFLERLNTIFEMHNKNAYEGHSPDYTPFGRALFSLLLEATNPYNTSKAYLNEKISLLFEED